MKNLNEIMDEVRQVVATADESELAAFTLANGGPVNFDHTNWLKEKLNDGDFDNIVKMWVEVERIGSDANIASLRAMLNRQSKSVLGHPVTVQGGRIVETLRRVRLCKGQRTKLNGLTTIEPVQMRQERVNYKPEFNRESRYWDSRAKVWVLVDDEKVIESRCGPNGYEPDRVGGN